MSAIDPIRQWCAAHGFAFSYGNPNHVEVWMGETDFASSTDGVAVFSHLLTAEEWDGSHDISYVGVWFAALVPFDFDNETIDATTERLKGYAKALLASIQQGNQYGWSGARFSYGYDDYAENVVWCCVRMTLTQLAAECVEQPEPPQPYPYAMVDDLLPEFFAALNISGTPVCPLTSTIDYEDNIGIAWVSQQVMDNPSVTVNGEAADIGTPEEIDGLMIEAIPSLTPYIGWQLYAGSYVYTDRIHEGDHVSVEVYEGDEKVLECGGVMPHVEEDNGGLRGTKKGGIEWPKLKR